MKKIILAGALSAVAMASYAEGGYVGIQYSMLDTEISASGFDLDVEPTAVNFVVGRKINDNFAVEGLLGVGAGDDEIDGTTTDFEVDTLINISAVGIIPLSNMFSIYGKLGIMSVVYSDSDGDKADAAGLSYGVGAAINATENLQFDLEYVVYPDGDYKNFDIDVETAALNLGVKVLF